MPQTEQSRRAYLQAIGIDVWLPAGESLDEPDWDDAEQTPTNVTAFDWPALRDAVAGCASCALSKSRTQTVFGVGNPKADWMFIGEAPGAEEDRRGEPFVGRAGQLLDEMLRAIGCARDSVFIANILKCRPPNNRDPSAEEANACRGYLERQIALVEPRVIVAVGKIAAQNLLGREEPVGKLRGQHDLSGTPLVVTYHPAYLLRSPTSKSAVWQDLCLAQRLAKGLPA